MGRGFEVNELLYVFCYCNVIIEKIVWIIWVWPCGLMCVSVFVLFIRLRKKFLFLDAVALVITYAQKLKGN